MYVKANCGRTYGEYRSLRWEWTGVRIFRGIGRLGIMGNAGYRSRGEIENDVSMDDIKRAEEP